MTPEVAGEKVAGEKRQLLSELFHALSQPITALRCSLELALHTPASVPSKENLQAALAHAEKIAQLAGGIRELIQADDPGDTKTELVLEDYLRETISDLQPIAAAAQVQMRLGGSLSGRVMAEPRRLQQALFYWLEFAIASASPGSVMDLRMSEQDGQAVVTLSAPRKQMDQAELPCAGPEGETQAQKLSRRLGLAIAGRMFESVGGGLQVQDGGPLRLRFYLPRAS